MLKKLIAVLFAIYAAAAFAAADANKASEAELNAIKGIGPVTATRIVEARKQGNFKNWNDLIERVKGIAPTSASKFSEAGLTINGQPFKETTPASTQKSPPSQKSAKPAQAAGKNQDKI